MTESFQDYTCKTMLKDSEYASLDSFVRKWQEAPRKQVIIEELEQSKRGIYGGAIGYLDFAGNLDTCIAIRLVYKKKGEICIRSGAGIVADSVPEKEFQECRNKARAVVLAIEKAQEGLE